MSSTYCIRYAAICDPVNGDTKLNAHLTISDGIISDLAYDDTTRSHECGSVVDGTGLYLIPGLIDCHDHLFNRRIQRIAPGVPIDEQRRRIFEQSDSYLAIASALNAVESLHRGVTTVRDMGSRAEMAMAVRDAVAGGLLLGPSILSAGQAVTMTGGHFVRHSLEADGPAAVAAAVRRQISLGADCVKLMASGGLTGFPKESPGHAELDVDELSAGVKAAHSAERRVAAHAQSPVSIDNAMRAEVDSVEHGFLMQPEQTRELASRGIDFTPTLSTLRNTISGMRVAGDSSLAKLLEEDILPVHEQAFRSAVAEGVRIGAGSDTTGPLSQELAIMVELGMSPAESLRTATSDAAGICGLSDRGRLAIGLRGDIVALKDNPLSDITTLDRINWVMSSGRIHDKSVLGIQFEDLD